MRKHLNQIVKTFHLEIIFTLLIVFITFMAQVSIAQHLHINLHLVFNSDLKTVRVLVDGKEVDINVQVPPYRITALIMVVHGENVEAIKFLINSGANVDLQDIKGVTALMLAIFKGNEEIVRILVNAGADITGIQSKDSYSALDYAIIRDDVGILNILSSKLQDKHYCLDALLSRRMH